MESPLMKSPLLTPDRPKLKSSPASLSPEMRDTAAYLGWLILRTGRLVQWDVLYVAVWFWTVKLFTESFTGENWKGAEYTTLEHAFGA